VFAGPGEAPIRAVLSACGYDYGKAPARMAAPAPRALPDPSAKAPAQADPDADQ
jgi:hypothetical protein